MAYSLIAPTWSGDVNGDGSEDLMDYRALQIMHGRETVEQSGRLLRGDRITLVDRPAQIILIDAADLPLCHTDVVDGWYSIARPIGLANSVRAEGDDVTCAPSGEDFVCSYVIWVEP